MMFLLSLLVQHWDSAEEQQLPAGVQRQLLQLLCTGRSSGIRAAAAVAGDARHAAAQSARSIPAERSQQQQQQLPPKQSNKQLRADLLPIPAFHQHQDMLQLLPGGRAYLVAAAAWVVPNSSQGYARVSLGDRMQEASAFAQALIAPHYHQQLTSDAPVLSAAAVRLVLELPLLAAGEVQQQRQQPASDARQQAGTAAGALQSDADSAQKLLLECNLLLHQIVRSNGLLRGVSLPPELLQQHGLQLLQALAAPVQQVLLSSRASRLFSEKSTFEAGVHLQLYSLRAAATGMACQDEGIAGEWLVARFRT
jgi:hypothetical protein